MVWEYFDSLRRLVRDAKSSRDRIHERQLAALALIMSVTVVEVFFNVWFRVKVEASGVEDDRRSLLDDLAHPRPASLEAKLKRWPARYLSREIDLSVEPAASFMRVKKLRNSIVHFRSTHESFEFESVSLCGLADTTEYDALSHEDASSALRAAEDMLAEVFRAAGIGDEQIPGLLHAWAGRGPSLEGFGIPGSSR